MPISPVEVLDLISAILLILVVFVPFGIMIICAVFENLRDKLLNVTFVWIQIFLWIIMDIVMVTGALFYPETHSSNLAFLCVGILFPTLYGYSLFSGPRLSSPKTPIEDKGAYDGDFVPGPERHEP